MLFKEKKERKIDLMQTPTTQPNEVSHVLSNENNLHVLEFLTGWLADQD